MGVTSAALIGVILNFPRDVFVWLKFEFCWWKNRHRVGGDDLAAATPGSGAMCPVCRAAIGRLGPPSLL